MKILGLFKVIVSTLPMENPSCGESIFFVNTIWLRHVMTIHSSPWKTPPMLSRHAGKNMAHLFRSMGQWHLFHGYFPWGTPNQNIRKGFLLPEDAKKKLGVRPSEKTTNPNISQHTSSVKHGGHRYDTDGISDHAII